MSEHTNEQSVGKMNPVSILVKVFTDPQEAFKNIKLYPNWVFPIFILLAFGFVFMFTTRDIQLEMQREYILESERIPEASKDAALENIENPTMFMTTIMPAIGVAVSTFLIPLLIAAAFLLFGNFVYGGSATFGLNFSAAVWAGLIGLLEGLIKLPLMLNKETLEVYTSLALVMDLSESKTFLFQMLNMVDIFAIWKIFVYSTAFMVIYKFSSSRSYATITGLYIVVSFIGIGFAQMFM